MDLKELQENGSLLPESSEEGEAEKEAIASPEKVTEAVVETEEKVVQATATPASAQDVSAAPAPKDEYLVKVENILEENLKDIFSGMQPAEQIRFKSRGEEVAIKIREFFEKAKIKSKEILKLISSWLQLIPGVNRFFLEQEAKIKTDRILELAEEHKKE